MLSVFLARFDNILSIQDFIVSYVLSSLKTTAFIPLVYGYTYINVGKDSTLYLYARSDCSLPSILMN
jgi:hypothetical protein